MAVATMHRISRDEVIWSFGPDADFTQRLYSVGFEVAEVRVHARSGLKAGGHHLIWLARR